jgi:hypothetical protein
MNHSKGDNLIGNPTGRRTGFVSRRGARIAGTACAWVKDDPFGVELAEIRILEE